MTETDAALLECQAQQDAVLGKPVRVKIGNSSYPALETPLTNEEILVDGGNADAGGMTAVVLASLFPRPPRNLEEFESSSGEKFKVQKVQFVNGSYYVTAYNPAAQIRQ